MVIAYTIGVALMLAAFYFTPSSLPWLQWLTVFMIGFFLYGPQMLIGLCGAELVRSCPHFFCSSRSMWEVKRGKIWETGSVKMRVSCPVHVSVIEREAGVEGRERGGGWRKIVCGHVSSRSRFKGIQGERCGSFNHCHIYLGSRRWASDWTSYVQGSGTFLQPSLV